MQMPQLYQQLSQQMLGAQVQALLGSQQAAQGTAGSESSQQLRPQLGGMPGQPPTHLLHQLLMQFPQRPSPQAGVLEGGQLRRPAGGAPAAQPATMSSWALPNGAAQQGTQVSLTLHAPPETSRIAWTVVHISLVLFISVLIDS